MNQLRARWAHRKGLPTQKESQVSQLLLLQKYRELRNRPADLPALNDVEFRCFSQNGEDGILLYLFALIGTTDRQVVELCAGDGAECNAANLLINHGWTGLLVDGSERNVQRGKTFFGTHPDTRTWPPRYLREWVTAENVNSLLRREGIEGPIDLLSLDLDGVDYWIWKAIDCIQPRVVVLEFQDILGWERALTVPYDPEFKVRSNLAQKNLALQFDYCGASLPAFVKLGKEKGYRLVGAQRYGFNAFFVKRGLAEELLPEVSAQSCLSHPKARFGMQERMKNVQDLPWVEV